MSCWRRMGGTRVPCPNTYQNRRVRSAMLLYCRGDWATIAAHRVGGNAWRRNLMALRTASPRQKHVQPRPLNHCAQCGETLFLPEWSEYLDQHRIRHLWECDACGYKYETLVSFPELDVSLAP